MKLDAGQLIKDFNDATTSDHRYASFDYCFNYFQAFRNKREIAAPKQVERSCLQLVSFLASWGMFRASGFLLRTTSVRHLRNVIELIASPELDSLWTIDCDRYDEAAKRDLCAGYDAIRRAVIPGGHRHLGLVTKIMLGVFGSVPAFDDRFTRSMRAYTRRHALKSCFRSFNNDSLDAITVFYLAHKQTIDRWSKKIRTYDFASGRRRGFRYTRAKIIDMIGFQANGGLVR